MLITLTGKDVMYKMVLPQKTVGNYWLCDKTKEIEKKLINIEGKDGIWQINSSNSVKLIDINTIKDIDKITIKPGYQNVNILDKIILEENKMYGVCFKNSDQLFVLQCLPVYDKFTSLEIKNKKSIFIGKGKENQIIYNNRLLANKHARIFFSDGKWRIENFDESFGTFVNSRIIIGKEKILFNGDNIFIMGLRMIMLNNTLYINNPNNMVKYDKNLLLETKINSDNIVVDDKKEENIDLYSEKDFFSKAPRITNIIERETVKIDAPPQIQDKEDMPLILTLGSSLTMGSMMLVSIMTAIDGKANGTTSTKQMVFSLITAGAMLIGMILFPILISRYNRRKKKKYEEKRQKRYTEYLNQKNEVINNIKNKQRKILYENYALAEECTNIIMSDTGRLWERNMDAHDFLTVRLGTGDVPLNIELQYPEEKFTMEDDNLLDTLDKIVKNSKMIENAPVVTSLVENNVSAIITEKNFNIRRFVQSLIVQLITFQTYEDLKLVFLLDEDTQKNWEYVKMLPHVWNNTKQVRFWADNYNDMKELSIYLEEDLKQRQENDDKDYKAFAPYYLIITDNYKKIENLKIVQEMLKAKKNVGFSLLCITNDLQQLPNECKTFINIDENGGTIFENEISANSQTKITFDTSVVFFFEKIAQRLSNIPIRQNIASGGLLPNSYTFLEMYDVGRIEQLNILERWKKNDATLSLKAPIGIDAAGMPILLDIHEKYHGPHGLIAGSTGSGKSEFIITYILSLAINYHPDDLNFILIDYKGGGLAGAFEKGNIKLPHLVGTITNIDTNGLQRSLASIQSELRRRQVIFNEARNKTDESTIDIYKYQKLYHKGIVTKPVPHLIIICDEFAELKQQQEAFMDELMSVSRIGRSLGVHLILATQKPAGIVNDQIRSNSKFAVCLKVQDRTDSMDVIKKPDAANLKRAGQFYLQVGNDEYFVLGQSAWAGAQYFPSDVIEKKVDNSIEFVSNIGVTIKQADEILPMTIKDEGEQLTNIVKYLDELAETENIKAENLWLEDIPELILLNETKEKYRFKEGNNNINPIIGEYDDPNNQRQGIVGMELSTQGNTIIFGNAESGKETLLSTMVYDLITTHTANEVQLYLLDFGTEALKIFRDAPQVGDVVFASDEEKVVGFFDLIQKEIANRKKILSDYNGDYQLYLKTKGQEMPMIVVVINNYEAFSELYDIKYDDLLLNITREGVKCGIVFVATISTYNDMRYRLAQNFKQKIALQVNKDDDYYSIFENVGKKRPSNIFGRGLMALDDGDIYEFQIARICNPEEYNIVISKAIKEQQEINKTKAEPIPVMPEKVSFEIVKKKLKGLSSVPIGMTKRGLAIYNYNFANNYINIITTNNMESAEQFITNILEEIKQIEKLNVKVFNAEKLSPTTKMSMQFEYLQFMTNIAKSKDKNNLCVIVGLDKFFNAFDEIKNGFNATMKEIEENDNCRFIIVESAARLKNYEYEMWYRNNVTKDTGIWIGNGIDNQYALTVNTSRRELINNCGNSYGYAIKQGIATLIKLLEMKDDGDLYE